jgi:hypothetical protein
LTDRFAAVKRVLRLVESVPQVNTGSANTVAFTAALETALVHPGDVITATATVDRNTPEFSAAPAVT